MFVFPRRLDQLSRFHRWVDSRCCSRRASVERLLCLKWLTMAFPMSSIPAILFLNLADDALQVTSPKAPFCVQNFFLQNFFRLCSVEENATLLQLCGARWRKLRSRSSKVTKFLRNLLASVAPKKNNESKQTDQIFKSSSTKFTHLVAKARLIEASDARATGRRSLSWRRSTLFLIYHYPPALQLFLS